MPYGPNGQWRPVSDTACAVHIMKIATGEIEERPRKMARVAGRATPSQARQEEPQETMLASSRPPHFITVPARRNHP